MAKKLLLCIFILFCTSIYAAPSYDLIAETLQGVKEHIDKKFQEAHVETHPFPHLVIENIFPPGLYTKIAQFWPDHSEFIGVRTVLPNTYGCTESTTLSTEQKIFWRVFGEVIVNRYVKPKIIEKLSPYFSLKLNMTNFKWKELNKVENFINLRQDALIEDPRNYEINPHVDRLNIFAAVLFYLPTDDRHQNFGTTFYEGGPNLDPNNIYDARKLKFIKKIPYKPNTLVTFLQTPISWHGVENAGYGRTSYVRRMYISPIFLSPEFMQAHYPGVYNRTPIEEYFFDHRFLCRQNWEQIWGKDDHYK